MTSLAHSCPDLPDCVIARQLGNYLRQHISPRKVNHEFSKKFETAEIHIFKVLVNTPLSHQILMNIRSFCICQMPIETNDFPNTTY